MDKTKRYLVKVTKTDIIQGNSCNSESCAIALALKRQFKIKPHVDDAFGELILEGYTENRKLVKLTTPLKRDTLRVIKFIQNFDSKRYLCRPFKFYVEKNYDDS